MWSSNANPRTRWGRSRGRCFPCGPRVRPMFYAFEYVDLPLSFSLVRISLGNMKIGLPYSPEDLPECSGGDKIRLICMGKGMLSPDSKTLEGADVPVFKTHPTPVNVAVKPEVGDGHGKKGSPKKSSNSASGGGGNAASGSGGAGGPQPGSSGCSCVIL
ncbi:hypothetical protein ACHAWF_006401 [Thalassiosira exigua]